MSYPTLLSLAINSSLAAAFSVIHAAEKRRGESTVLSKVVISLNLTSLAAQVAAIILA